MSPGGVLLGGHYVAAGFATVRMCVIFFFAPPYRTASEAMRGTSRATLSLGPLPLSYPFSLRFFLFTDFGLVVRSQRFVGLVGGSPTYDLVEAFQAPDASTRTYRYSPDGRLFALAVPSGCVN